MGFFLRNFVQLLVLVLWALVLARVIVSWVDPQGRNPIARQVVTLTEPFLAPIRRLLPSTGALDLSPLILMLVLSALLGVVGR
ncbi:MAG TPA: YggT family protein [Candidatus Limnocylindrales bacterium]|jgi:YggT family protein